MKNTSYKNKLEPNNPSQVYLIPQLVNHFSQDSPTLASAVEDGQAGSVILGTTMDYQMLSVIQELAIPVSVFLVWAEQGV